ncbi:hypothetical protein D3C71_1765970 [compost metagenome]
MQHELALFERLTQAPFQAQRLGHAGVHLRGIEQQAVCRRLGLVGGRFGVAQQCFSVGAIHGVQGNAGLGGHAQLGATDGKGGIKTGTHE